jgi:hypothetical protein
MRQVWFSLGVILLASCASQRYVEGQFEEAIAPPQPPAFTVTWYKNPSGELPQWLQGYLDADEKRVETMPDYAEDYVFVTNEKGSGLPALEKWSEYFRIEQDFSHTVFLRMYNRLLAESQGRPDYYFGNFFEIFLKKIAGHTFEGASRVDDYWIKVSVERETAIDEIDLPEAAEAGSVALEVVEEYRYYILSKINRTALQQELAALFSAALSEVKLENPQAATVSKLQSTLFFGF